MTEDQKQPESARRHASHHSGRSHRGRRSSRRSSSETGNPKITLVQVLLLIWSLAAMLAFLWLLEDEKKASLTTAIWLAVATVIGLILFLRTLPKKK